VTVHDLGSTNGVILNGQRVSDGHVRDGSHIQLANTEIVVRITESAGSSDFEDDAVATSTTIEGGSSGAPDATKGGGDV
jgi:pSer/pThr/pTyr-binding forkhead associated (FHA) protein